MKEYFSSDKFKLLIEKLTAKRNIAMFISILLQLISLVLAISWKRWAIPFIMISMALPSVVFFATVPLIEATKDNKDRKALLSKYGFSIVILFAQVFNLIILLLVGGGFTFGPGNGLSIPVGPLLGLIDFISIIFTSFTMRSGETQINLGELIHYNIWKFFKVGIGVRTKKTGDIELCRNYEDDTPVIIPFKDRFLHMLILGPTGSGKTSQTIIPMINQDVQNFDAGITVIEPKGDLAEKIYAMAQHYGRPAIYFNPILDACPTFNPLYGKEEDVIENMTTAFKMLDPDSPQYFKDMNEQLLRNGLKVLKRLKGNKATMIDLSRLVSNSVGEGRKMVMAFSKKSAPTEALAKENADVANYFLSDYFNEKSKTYDNTSGVRGQIARIVSNKYLRKVLNPENGKSDVDFDKHLDQNTIICISTAQGKLRDLGKFLGYFIILNFQSSVFKRRGDEFSRSPHFLYIDEFQEYANPGFSQMLTQGRSYRVASHLATQNRALIGMGSGRDGDNFLELVSTNARNIVIYPGSNFMDAKYFSELFGEVVKRDKQTGITKQKFHPLYGEGSAPSESVRYSEKDVARYSPTDIMYRKFGDILYRIMEDDTVQIPGIGLIDFIPFELNERLKVMVTENNMLMALNRDPNVLRDLDNSGILKPEVDLNEIHQLYEKFLEYDNRDNDDEEEDGETSNPQGNPNPNPNTSPNTSPNTNFNQASKPVESEDKVKRERVVPMVDVEPLESKPSAKVQNQSAATDDIDFDEFI